MKKLLLLLFAINYLFTVVILTTALTAKDNQFKQAIEGWESCLESKGL